MLNLLWPLLIVIFGIPDLIWQGTAYFVQNNTTIILPGNTRRTTSQLPCRTLATHFWRQIRSVETQNVSLFFHFLQSDMVFGLVNPISQVFNAAISSEKSCLISMAFLLTYIDVRTVKFFPPAESWLVDSNFPHGSRMQGLDHAHITWRKGEQRTSLRTGSQRARTKRGSL